MIPPNLWRSWPFVDVRALGVVVALTFACCALCFSGAMMLNVGCPRLGYGMIVVGLLAFVAAGQVEW